MKLKNDIVFNEQFANAFAKLLKLPFPSTISIQIVETLRALGEQQKNVYAVRDGLLDRLAVKGEDGKFIFDGQSVRFSSKDAEVEFFKEMEELLKLEFDIPLVNKLKLDDKIILSGEEIITLKPVLDVNF